MPDRPHPRKVSAGPATIASQNRCVALPVPPPATRDRHLPESLPASSGMQAYEKIGVVNIDELANELNVKVTSITQGFLKQQRGSSPAPAPAQPAQAPPAAVRTRRTPAASDGAGGATQQQGGSGSFAYPGVANSSLQGGGRYMIDALDDILKASDLTAGGGGGGGSAAAAAEPSPPAAPERSAPVPAAASDVPRLSSNPPGASRAESPASDFTFGSFDDRTEPPSMAVVAAAATAAAAATTTTSNPRSGSGTYLDGGAGDPSAAHRSDSFIEQEQARQRRAGAEALSNASLTLTVLRDGAGGDGSNGSGADAESDVSSIMSGPEEMFPSADDPSWIHIPQRDESPCCSSSEETGGHRGGGGGDTWATPQPSLTAGANTALASFLDKEAVLPAGNILGNATFHMNAWFQSAIPRLPTTTTMCIVQDGSGAHYGNIQSTGGGDKRGSAGTTTTVGPSALASVNAPPPAAGTANNGGVTRMTRRLQLPTLPCEVKSVSIYRRPGDSYVSLTVVLSRPFLAWLALFIAFLLQSIETFVYVKELREPCHDAANATTMHVAHGGAALYGSDDGVDSVFSQGVSVAELWVAELFAVLLIPLCLTAWCMGEFDGAGGGKYARTRHGLVFVLGFLVAFACYTVPFSKHTAQAGSITMLYPLPVLLMVLARLATTQRISFRAMAGVVLFTVGFIAGRGLPDSDTACGSTRWSWAVVTLGCFGLAACLALAKRVRPHFPLPLLLLTVALGGCLAQVYFAASSGLPAKTIFLGFTDRPAFIYEMVWLVALRGGALTAWLWSIMYLSPLTVAAPMVGQRIVALAALSIYQHKDDAPGLAGQLLPLIPTFLGIVVLCSIDLKDRQKKVRRKLLLLCCGGCFFCSKVDGKNTHTQTQSNPQVKLNDRAASALAGGEGRRKGSVMTQQGRAPQASRSLATLHGSQAGESFASSTQVLSQEEGEQRRLLGSEQRARR